MLRHPPLVFALLLTACARPDTEPPQVGLVTPLGGGVAPGRSLVAEGYAFDPSGVGSVRVNGQEVLPQEERGKRLVRFRFRLEAPSSGWVQVRLQAEDGAGNRREREVTLTLDATPPRIRIDRVEREGSLLRVYGVVEDNVGVERVSLRLERRYIPLSLPKGTAVPFVAEASPGATLVAVDAAGNRAERPLP